jgi:hypothetical protein
MDSRETEFLYDVEPESTPLQIFKREPDEMYCEGEVLDLPINERVIVL